MERNFILSKWCQSKSNLTGRGLVDDWEVGKAHKNIEDEHARLSRKQSIKAWRNELIKQQTFNMLKNSSLHGVPHMFADSYPIRRFLWMLVTLVFFAYSVQKVYESTVRYFEYPFSTARMRKYPDKIDFPAVSFCNMNDMKMSVLNGTVVDQAILDKSKTFTSEDYRNITALAVHTLKDMLIDCSFNGWKCSADDFTEFFWQHGDKCFTFNSGKIGKNVLSVNGAGLKRGLRMTLNIQHHDYYRDRQEAGIHLMMHSQLETPVKIIGQMIPPGYTTYIKVFKRKIINLKHPYKTECGSISLKYFDDYSMNLCWLEKLTDHVIERCKCKDFFMPGEFKICNLTQSKDCMWKEWVLFDKAKKYNCPLPCEIESFHGTASRSLFPLSSLNDVTFQELLNKSQEHNLVNYITPTEFLRDNLLQVLVFYDDLSFEILEQQPSYDTLVWLGDIGGQIGLFVGAGVMSYFEILDSLILMLYTYFFAQKHDKYVNQSDSTELVW